MAFHGSGVNFYQVEPQIDAPSSMMTFDWQKNNKANSEHTHGHLKRH